MSYNLIFITKCIASSILIIIITWNLLKQSLANEYDIHVIELLYYNWKFANSWLEIWSHDWRFYIDVFDACFLLFIDVFLLLVSVLNQLHPILFTFLSYVILHIMLATSRYQPSLLNISNVVSGGSANQIAVC